MLATTRCSRQHVLLPALLLLAMLLGLLVPGRHTAAPATTPVDAATGCFPSIGRDALDAQARQAVDLGLRKLAAADVAPYTAYPSEAAPTASAWSRTSSAAWTAGFYPGALWQAYELTGDPTWRSRAERWTSGLAPVATSTTHDLGFLIQDSFGQGIRLAGHPDYQATVRTAANSLDAHYDPVVHANWSWYPAPFNVIVDSSMNLHLLFSAARTGGTPVLAEHALDHALTVSANHIRPDGSTYHAVDFDPVTGAATRHYTVQGYADESTWARGQAWAIYGMTEAWNDSGDPRLREAAGRAADWWLAHLPAGCVPFVDFDAPPGPGQVVDSSAAAIAASALLELVRLDPLSPRAPDYRAAALATIQALTSSPYLSTSPSQPSLLLHESTQWTASGMDTSLIWGDYYLLEALVRLRDLPRDDVVVRPVSTVTASSSDGNLPGNVVDGSLATRWSAAGDGQWVQLDLGSSQSVSGVRLAQYSGDRRAARFDVLGSTDGRTWYRLSSAVSSGRTAAPQTYSFTPEVARYVRYVGHGNTESTWNSVTEFAALAQPGVRLPTAMRLSVDRTTSVTGRPVVVGMRVVDAVTNVGVGGVPVQLWQHLDGGPWYQTENRITDGTGLVKVTRYPTVPVTYQARFGGTDSLGPSASSTLRVAVHR